ncbi:GIY-YIG nuclease family protein [Patescibacteria group bacterium]|nr:MAG: GIY-YIG nuclease family protein [Patescibacteria group bacterium]
MYYVYILERLKDARWYIGSTKNVEERLTYHNAGKITSTRPHRPYRLVYLESFENKTQALLREKQIKKSGIIRKAIKSRVEKYGPIV